MHLGHGRGGLAGSHDCQQPWAGSHETRSLLRSRPASGTPSVPQLRGCASTAVTAAGAAGRLRVAGHCWRGERSTDIPPLTWHTALTTWTSAPIFDVLAALAVVGYLTAVRRRSRTAASGWPLHATASWLAGVVVLLLSVHSSIEVYGHALLWVHMIQHLLLIMVVPILLIWGQPVRLIWGRMPGGRLVRWLTFPVLAVGLYTAVLVATHLTGFPELMATQ